METITLEQKITELKEYCTEHPTCSTCLLRDDAACLIAFCDLDKIEAKYEQYKILKTEEAKKEITDQWNKLHSLLRQHFCYGHSCTWCGFYNNGDICHLKLVNDVIVNIGEPNVSN